MCSIACLSDALTDVKMWHIGIHIWDVNPNDIEPNYEEYHRVRIFQPHQASCLIVLDPPRIQPPQHTYPPTRESVHHPSPPTSWLGHRMDEEDSIRHTHFYCRECSNPMVSVHIHLSASDWEHVVTTDFWRATLHGPTKDGRDADLGHLRESPLRSSDFSNPLHYCSPYDERKTSITASGTGGLHLQLSVSFCRCCRTLLSDTN